MNDRFNTAIELAAQNSFFLEMNSTNKASLEIGLDRTGTKALSQKILSLPVQGMLVLFSKYCFRFSPADVKLFYGIEDAKALLQYYKSLLSYLMGVNQGALISDDTFENASKIALEEYLVNEIGQNEIRPTHHGSFGRKFVKSVIVAAIITTISFSAVLITHAEFREKVTAWLIEQFDKYSIFQLGSNEQSDIQELERFTPHYIPQGFQLKNTIKQPSLILYEYVSDRGGSLWILMSLSDTKVLLDTEGCVLEEIETESGMAYYFQKDSQQHILFDNDGFFFAVYGTLDKQELFSVAKEISRN